MDSNAVKSMLLGIGLLLFAIFIQLYDGGDGVGLLIALIGLAAVFMGMVAGKKAE